VCLVGQLLILVQKRWHWHRFALVALAYLAYVLAVIGPEAALRRHFYVHQHFWQYVALLLGFGPPGATLSIGQLAHDVVLTQLWLGLPVGLLAAALAVYFAEHAAGNAEWSPLVRRRALVDQRARDRKTAKLLAKPRDHKLSAPALGIALDGDLPSWIHGRYVVPPAHLRGKAMALVGAPGAGKTVTLTRLAYLAGRLGRKVCFADCKGTDPTLVPALINAYRLGNPTARIGRWPATAMDMWRGTPPRSNPGCCPSSSSPSRSTSASPAPACAWPSPRPTCHRSTARTSCSGAWTLTSWPPCGKATRWSSRTSR
jgi:hypothetical protein